MQTRLYANKTERARAKRARKQARKVEARKAREAYEKTSECRQERQNKNVLGWLDRKLNDSCQSGDNFDGHYC